MIKAVIFDFDGTLVNSLEPIISSMNHVLVRHGFPIHNSEEYKMFVGSGIEALVYRALPASVRDTGKLPDYIEEYRDIYEKSWRKTITPYPGIRSMLKELNRREIRLFILSNKTDYFTKLQCAELFGDIDFSEVSGAKEGIPIKPAPFSALEMVNRYKINPGESLFVGDSDIDIKTALNANMHPVGVSWGFRKIKELIDAGAESVLYKAEDLFSLL